MATNNRVLSRRDQHQCEASVANIKRDCIEMLNIPLIVWNVETIRQVLNKRKTSLFKIRAPRNNDKPIRRQEQTGLSQPRFTRSWIFNSIVRWPLFKLTRLLFDVNLTPGETPGGTCLSTQCNSTGNQLVSDAVARAFRPILINASRFVSKTLNPLYRGSESRIFRRIFTYPSDWHWIELNILDYSLKNLPLSTRISTSTNF